jgi:hypothetical protein
MIGTLTSRESRVVKVFFGLFIMATGAWLAYMEARQWKNVPQFSACGVFVAGSAFAVGLMHVIDWWSRSGQVSAIGV